MFYIWSLIISNGQWILRMVYLYYMEQTMLPLSHSFTIVLFIPTDVNGVTLFALLSLLHSPLISWEMMGQKAERNQTWVVKVRGELRDGLSGSVSSLNVMWRCHDIWKHENFYFFMKMSKHTEKRGEKGYSGLEITDLMNPIHLLTKFGEIRT